MHLREEILKEHSKRKTDIIVRYVGDNQKKFDTLVNLFLSDDPLVSQRAGWPLSYIAIAHPHLMKKHFKDLLLNQKKRNLHNAVVRNTFRLMQFAEIPELLHGLTADMCFKYFNDRKQPVAIRCFSMTVLGNLVKIYPEMKNELMLSIEAQLPYAEAGFKSRARRILLELELT